jgi:hypothetical protein
MDQQTNRTGASNQSDGKGYTKFTWVTVSLGLKISGSALPKNKAKI